MEMVSLNGCLNHSEWECVRTAVRGDASLTWAEPRRAIAIMSPSVYEKIEWIGFDDIEQTGAKTKEAPLIRFA